MGYKDVSNDIVVKTSFQMPPSGSVVLALFSTFPAACELWDNYK
jgi:hypothetical protein